MPPVGFEPTIAVGERPYFYALDRAATGTGTTTPPPPPPTTTTTTTTTTNNNNNIETAKQKNRSRPEKIRRMITLNHGTDKWN
jgi:hypothetical protein